MTANSREQRELRCKLGEDDLRARGDEMADTELEIDRLKESRRGLNGEIAKRRTRRNELATAIEARSELRMVDCVWIEQRTCESLVRQDTGEHIEQRPRESQVALPLDDAPAAGDGDSDADVISAFAEQMEQLCDDDDEPPAKKPAARKPAKKSAAKAKRKAQTLHA